jgi:ABC-type transport system involved in multi-copper enzyme maturation permease subunit
MIGSLASQFLPCLLLAAIQFLVALPWLWAVDPDGFKKQARSAAGWGAAVGVVLGITLTLDLLFSFQRSSPIFNFIGRCYGSILHLQLLADAFVIVLQLLLLAWPKGGAVALAAFREGMRQPMFWLIAGAAIVIVSVAVFVPYFTFGDDYKMMKQICFDTTMLGAVLFGVLAASMSIHDEIEGRTAITLMSKPVNRRQFLLGKYLGILLSAFALTLIVGWCVNWALHYQPTFNPLDEVVDPMPAQVKSMLTPKLEALGKGDSAVFWKGTAAWLGEASANTLGLVLGFGQLMVLLAIASALATRLPMVANVILCMVMFFLGHLAPVLKGVSQELQAKNPNTAMYLVSFLTQLLDAVVPALGHFNMGPAIIRDTPIDVAQFTLYVGSVLVYAVVYTTIALLFGLILFEDRDLA